METGKRNKMVTSSTKGAKRKTEPETYFFPSLGVSVEAASREEAEKKAKEKQKTNE